MSNKIWQDETVQALKHGYQEEIDVLRNYITALETAGREVVNAIDGNGQPGALYDARNKLAALLGETK